MNTKILVTIIAVVVAAGALYVFSGNAPALWQTGGQNTTQSPLLAEENAVVVLDQRPGGSVTVAQVYLAASGYLVIHEAAPAGAGAIIGASQLLAAGSHEKVAVTLSRPTRDGETLYAMLHADTDGNGAFDAAVDAPVQSTLGGPIMGTFSISSQAEENVEINL